MNTDDYIIIEEVYEGHTPGPWVAEHNPDRSVGIKSVSEHTRRCVHTHGSLELNDTPCYSRRCDVGQSLSDTNLIAAAPDLLAEVKRLRELIQRVAETEDDEGCEGWTVIGKEEWDALWKAVSE